MTDKVDSYPLTDILYGEIVFKQTDRTMLGKEYSSLELVARLVVNGFLSPMSCEQHSQP